MSCVYGVFLKLHLKCIVTKCIIVMTIVILVKMNVLKLSVLIQTELTYCRVMVYICHLLACMKINEKVME